MLAIPTINPTSESSMQARSRESSSASYQHIARTRDNTGIQNLDHPKISYRKNKKIGYPLGFTFTALDLHARSRQLRIHRAERLAVQHQAGVGLTIELRLRHLLFDLSLVITPLVLDNVAEHRPVEDTQDQHDPEDIDHLQHRQESESDGLRDPALVLLRVPVKIVGADGCELAIGEHGVEDLEVEEVAHVRPDADKGDKVRNREVRVKVIEDFGGLGTILGLMRF
jgi:hypothetical protein